MSIVSIKDPIEEVTVTFDFTLCASVVTLPTVSVVVEWAENTPDSTPASVLIGAPQISLYNQALVHQRVGGGLHMNNYGFRCVARIENGDLVLVSLVLPVRTLP